MHDHDVGTKTGPRARECLSGFGHIDFKRTLGQRNQLLHHGSVVYCLASESAFRSCTKKDAGEHCWYFGYGSKRGSHPKPRVKGQFGDHLRAPGRHFWIRLTEERLFSAWQRIRLRHGMAKSKLSDTPQIVRFQGRYERLGLLALRTEQAERSDASFFGFLSFEQKSVASSPAFRALEVKSLTRRLLLLSSLQRKNPWN